MSCTCSTDLKPLERNGHTASCNHAQRKAARQPKTPARRKIKPVGAKQAERLKVYAVKRKEHLKRHPDCQMRLKDICRNDRSTNSVHHCAKRGANLNNEETFMTACAPCHSHVESVMNAAERREKGFLK